MLTNVSESTVNFARDWKVPHNFSVNFKRRRLFTCLFVYRDTSNGASHVLPASLGYSAKGHDAVCAEMRTH